METSLYRTLMAKDDAALRAMYQNLHGEQAPGYLQRLKIVSAIMKHPDNIVRALLGPQPAENGAQNGASNGTNGQHQPAPDDTGAQLAAMIRALAAGSMDESKTREIVAGGRAACPPPPGPHR